ncbi:TadE/TadG family type IV pilus assembly protein [Blastopirellula marina]|nr:pilus assembly protein TadG-related protein [Blastopirellula marina]
MTPRRSRPALFSRASRRGVSLLWLILAFPALILFLVFVVEIGNVWLARVELEESMEACSLAAVKEWSQHGGESTLIARQVGNQFALANPVRGMNVDLGNATLNPAFDGSLNYDSVAINGNAACTSIDWDTFAPSGVLVFGAITQTEATSPGGPSVVFDATASPSCGGLGGVPLLVDVSAGNDLGASGEDNEWGVSLFTSPDDSLNNGLRINRIEIDVDPYDNSGNRFADFTPGVAAELSGNVPANWKITAGGGQPDNYFVGSSPPIVFSRIDGDTTLRIDFDPGMTYDGLAPGERFRFSTNVLGGASGTQELGSDDLGTISTEVRVYYSFEGVPAAVPVIQAMLDNTDDGGSCVDQTITDDLGLDHGVEHPELIPDLPCPPIVSSGANGQSYLRTNIAGVPQHFAVRAQASVQVSSVVGTICGIPLGPWGVSAKSTAYYDCTTGDTKLIRVDLFQCVPP